MTHLRQRFSRFGRERSGIAAIEFAFIGPVLALLTVAAADAGLGFYSYMQVQNSAQVGAEYAISHGFDATGISNAVLAATPGQGISASPAPSQFCACPSSSTVTQATCGSTCSDGSAAGGYVQVTATKSYSTIIPYPLFPASFTQTAISTVRIQ